MNLTHTCPGTDRAIEDKITKSTQMWLSTPGDSDTRCSEASCVQQIVQSLRDGMGALCAAHGDSKTLMTQIVEVRLR